MQTTIEQSERLMLLGVPPVTASKTDDASGVTPAWTTDDLMDLLPERVGGNVWAVSTRKTRGEYVLEYTYKGRVHHTLITHAPRLLDAAYEMVVLLIKEHFIDYGTTLDDRTE